MPKVKIILFYFIFDNILGSFKYFNLFDVKISILFHQFRKRKAPMIYKETKLTSILYLIFQKEQI